MRTHTEHPKVCRHPAHVTYEQTPSIGNPLTVERLMVARGMAVSEGAAYQKLCAMREEMARYAELFHATHSPHRLPWFTEQLDRAVDQYPVQSLTDADVAEEETDGDEGTSWALHLATPCLATWRAYKRIAHRYIARLTLKLRAGDAKWEEQSQ